MAESIMTHLIKLNGLYDKFIITSSATSREEIGNPPHFGTISVLKKHNIDLVPHVAKQITKFDARRANYLIVMDENNVFNLKRIINKEDYYKINLLLSFANISRYISDPWYTGNFEQTYDDVFLGCSSLLEYLMLDIDKN